MDMFIVDGCIMKRICLYITGNLMKGSCTLQVVGLVLNLIWHTEIIYGGLKIWMGNKTSFSGCFIIDIRE